MFLNEFWLHLLFQRFARNHTAVNLWTSLMFQKYLTNEVYFYSKVIWKSKFALYQTFRASKSFWKLTHQRFAGKRVSKTTLFRKIFLDPFFQNICKSLEGFKQLALTSWHFLKFPRFCNNQPNFQSFTINYADLTHFMPLVFFWTPWKH